MYREILAQNPNDPDALHMLGMLGGQTGHHGPGIELVSAAIRNNPTNPIYYLTLSELQLNSAQNQEAIDTCDAGLKIKPDFAELYNHLGVGFKALGRIDEALEAYRQALRLSPNLSVVHNNLAGVHKERGELDEALSEAHEAVRLRPETPLFHFTLGETFNARRENQKAIPHFLEALRLNPNFVPAILSLGNAHMGLQQYSQALDHFERVVSINPQSADAWVGIGIARWELGYIHACIHAFQNAIEIDPNSKWGHFNLGNILLLMGDFENGWKEYEWRPLLPLNRPRWDGSSLAGKTILLHVEQGVGDIIQFIRYAPMVKAMGARIILGCRPALFGLMATIPSIDVVTDTVEETLHYDVHLPLLSLPRIFKTDLTNIPNQIPYIFANPSRAQEWNEKLRFPKDRLKVGLAWAGSPGHNADRYRSISLAQLAPLAQVSNVTYYSFQTGPGALKPGETPEGMDIVDVGPDLKDYTDSAAIVSHLDLVITVDTSMAHLAGAMGKPTWILLRSQVPDWRWLLERSDSPWYPTARLFRQKGNDWATVIQRVAAELAILAHDPPAR